MATISVGAAAPDFKLKDENGNEVSLSSHKGKDTVVLAFYPFDFSPICSTENSCMSNDLPKFGDAKATLYGISCDSWFTHKAWKEKLGLKQTLLSDLHRTTVKAYGLHREDLNCAERATVIVDKSGIVRFVKVQQIKDARDDNEILKALATIG